MESDGEILIKSRSIMRGYYNKLDITADTLGRMAAYWRYRRRGCGWSLKIIDRKKALIKTSE